MANKDEQQNYAGKALSREKTPKLLFEDFNPMWSALENFAAPLNNFFREPEGPPATVLRTDLIENDKCFKYVIEMPGMSRKDITLSIEKETFAVSGERKTEINEETENFYHRECHYGKFSRSLPLPDGTDVEGIEAKFKNGVLTVTLPKLEEEKAKKVIEITEET